MFSFIKKLFNFEKKDRNTVAEQQQVKFETNSNHGSLVDSKIKDISLNKSYKNNESHQLIELSKFRDLYSKKSNFSSSVVDKSLSKYHENNETRQKAVLSKFNNFPAKKSTSSASESNVHGSFDNQVNTISKSQRKCKKLATKKIKEVIKDLSLDSNEIDDMADECTEPKSKEKPKLIKISKKLHQKNVRFCFDCKTFQTVVGNATVRRNCNNCNSILYYVCLVCKDKYYASYHGWKTHQRNCNCKSSSQKMESVGNRRTSKQLNSAFNEKMVRLCLIKTKAIATQAKEPVLKNTGDGVNVEGGMGKALNKEVIAVKPTKKKRFQKWIRRFCPKCQKPIARKILHMKKKIKCPTCTTLLQFECIKCHIIKVSDSGIYHHFRQQCFPNDDMSVSSKIRSTKSRLMSSTQLIQNKCLKCDMCNYQSEFKTNLKRHLNTVHMQK